MLGLVGHHASRRSASCSTRSRKGYDFFTYFFTLVLTPMIFLSGVYFPIEQMPPWLQAIAQVLPLKAAVDLVRPLVLGNIPADPLGPLADPRRVCVQRLLSGAGAHPAPVLPLAALR